MLPGGGNEPLLASDVKSCTKIDGKNGGVRSQLASRLDLYFQITARGSTIEAELRGGLAGFMTMSYILVVNPRILSVAAAPYGIGLSPLMTATAASSAIMSFAIGVIANVPFGIMPGMGLNAYLTYSVCKALNISWQQALSASFVGGALLTLLSCLGICDFVVRWVLPEHLKKAITVAIGVFQALIGFQTMGLVVGAPATLITLGDLSPVWPNASLYLGLGGLLLITTLIVVAKMNGSMFIGILTMAIVSWAVGLERAPTDLFSTPSWGAVFQIDFSGWVPGRPEFPGLVISALVIFFVCLFDVAGVQHGLQSACNLPESHSRSSRIIGSAGVGTVLGSLLGTSPLVVAVESSSSIMEGARTGLASVVTAALFAVSLTISPLLCAVPRVATAVPLIVVGGFMMAPASSIDWGNIRIALPSFLTVTLVPFTYSIHNGILGGLLLESYLAGMTRICGSEEEAIETDDTIEELRTPNHAPMVYVRKNSSPYCSPKMSPQCATPNSNDIPKPYRAPSDEPVLTGAP